MDNSIMKNGLLVITLVFSANVSAHPDVLKEDDQISGIIASCESERDSTAAQMLGADKHVEICISSDLNRVGKLKRYREKHPSIYDSCHQVQPYGLSATVMCIESQI